MSSNFAQFRFTQQQRQNRCAIADFPGVGHAQRFGNGRGPDFHHFGGFVMGRPQSNASSQVVMTGCVADTVGGIKLADFLQGYGRQAK